MRKQKGFTLMEVMITLVIIAILAAIAYPSYQNSLRKGRRADGKNAMLQTVANIERYYNEHNTYDFSAGGLCGSTPVICVGSCSAATSTGVCTSPDRYYTIAASNLASTTFTLEATPQGGQVGDGKLYIDQTGLKKQDANNNGTYDSGESVWQ